MGQRLVIAISDDDDNPTQKACVYYHWSGYFAPAVYETYQICKAIKKAEKEGKDPFLSIERMLEEKGGGVRGTDEDLEFMKKLYPGEEFKTGSRNEGIITFTDEGISSFSDWAESDVIINTKTRTIDFDCFYDPEPFEIGNNFRQDLGDAGYIVGTFKSGSGYVRCSGEVCPIDIYKGLTIDNFKKVYAFMSKFS